MEWWEVVGLVLMVLVLGPWAIRIAAGTIAVAVGALGSFFEGRSQRRLDRHYDG